MSNAQPRVCAPDTGLVAKRASLQSWNSIPDTTSPCLTQGAVTRGGSWVPEHSLSSLLPLAVLVLSLTTRESLAKCSVNSHFLSDSPAACTERHRNKWLRSKSIFCCSDIFFARLMRQSESYCSLPRRNPLLL